MEGVTPTDDSYVGDPNDINGDFSYIALRNISDGNWLCAGAIKFDISSIPASSSIASASLHLYYYGYEDNNPGGHPVALHRFKGDWNEETIMRTNMPSWSGEISAVTNISSLSENWLIWDVTSDVQKFVSGILTDYGWCIIDEYYWDGANIPITYLYSKEYGSYTPYLEIIFGGNSVPSTPFTPFGPQVGKPGISYTYQTVSFDANGDQIYYMWDWDDGTPLTWTGLYNSGQSATASHVWSAKGTYSIKVKAKDIHGKETSWSDPWPIAMPYSYKPIPQFLVLLFQRFPNTFPLLRQLLG